MFSYIAFAWDHSSVHQRGEVNRLTGALLELGGGWKPAYETHGLSVFCTGAREGYLAPRRIGQRCGVLLGKLFGSGGRALDEEVGEPEALRIAASRGQVLVDDYWGSYVAIVKEADAGEIHIVRAPVGLLQCYVTEVEGVHIFASSVRVLSGLGLKFSINWDYVAAELTQCAAMGWDQTGLRELRSLCPGERLTLTKQKATYAALWDPFRFALEPLEDIEAAVSCTREAVTSCVSSWASTQEHVALSLSGGLDSSIVLACLKNCGELKTSCFNLYFRGAYSDERYYARLAAAHAKSELMEIQRPSSIDMASLLALPRTARPSNSNTDHILFGLMTTALTRRIGATAVMVGHMGDQLFCRGLAGFAAMDYVWAHSMDRDFIWAAVDAARIDGTNVWGLIRHGAFDGTLARTRRFNPNKRINRSRQHNALLNWGRLGELDFELTHQWSAKVDGVPPGKLLQVVHILSGASVFCPIGDCDDPDWVLPLYSQPVAEACLRIPLYVHIHGGLDRAVQRRAFMHELPSQIVSRQTKGNQTEQRRKIYEDNRRFVTELLLDGVLAGQKLLNLDLVRKVLTDPSIRPDSQLLERCFWTEAWLRGWHGGPTRAIESVSCAGNESRIPKDQALSF